MERKRRQYDLVPEARRRGFQPEALGAQPYGRAGGAKSGRGGAALLAGMMCCAKCRRRLSVSYRGRRPQPVHSSPSLKLNGPTSVAGLAEDLSMLRGTRRE